MIALSHATRAPAKDSDFHFGLPISSPRFLRSNLSALSVPLDSEGPSAEYSTSLLQSLFKTQISQKDERSSIWRMPVWQYIFTPLSQCKSFARAPKNLCKRKRYKSTCDCEKLFQCVASFEMSTLKHSSHWNAKQDSMNISFPRLGVRRSFDPASGFASA